MFSRSAKVAATLAIAAVGIVGVAADAHALNLNIHGTAFQPYSGTPASVVKYSSNGVSISQAGPPQAVIAPVIRSGLSATTQDFFIDGANPGGLNTSFVLYAYNYDGTPQSSLSFASSAATYDLFETLPTVGVFSYISLLSNLPPADSAILYGVTAIQP